MSKRNPDIEATEPDTPVSRRSNSSKSDLTNGAEHNEFPGYQQESGRKASVVSTAAKLRNPLAGLTEEEVIADVDAWCVDKGLTEHQDAFRKGALIARMGQRDDGYEYVSQLSSEEKDMLRYEQSHRWSQPFMLYFLVVLCAGSAIVQGMDQTAVNGAQGFYFREFNIGEDEVWLRGLLNGAPYVCLLSPPNLDYILTIH